jgi:hypothetical protein
MHPYSQLPNQNFWKRFVSNTSWRNLNLGGEAKFKISASHKVATAGSCFAQHIARHMNLVGRSTYFAEIPHPLIQQFGGETKSYEIFSARYGNVYTARQCLELFNQAFGKVSIIEDYFEQEGKVYDLLRPNAVPEGFLNLRECSHDRIYHLSCVKTMFETADVFIFTLGLTESWYNTATGHTYPVCPGTARGEYDAQLHKFRNFTHSEVLSDMDELIDALLEVNPSLKIILTVSPVPLVATFTDTNVLVASSYSKSVLRAVCGEIESRHPHVQYFPSFEIISHAASFGQYLASDLREVSERGVSHVMDCFFSIFLNSLNQQVSDVPLPTLATPADLSARADITDSQFNAECDEIFNDLLSAPNIND